MRLRLPGNQEVYCSIAGFVVGILVCLITDIRSFSVDPTTGSIEFRTREPNDVEYIQSAWEDAARRQILLGTLANQGVFAVDDPRIAAAIENLCEPIPSTPLEAYLSAAIKCAEQPVPNALRQLARQKSPPFHTSGRVVSIGVPDTNDQPSVGRANTCQNGEWFRRRVLLTNPLNGFQVTVDATGHYGQGICGPIVGAPDIQLNEGDALSIFRLRYIVRRAKALAPSGCKSRPANCRSSRKQSERLMEATTWTEALCCKRVASGRFSEHAGRNQMNAEQASKKVDAEADPPM